MICFTDTYSSTLKISYYIFMQCKAALEGLREGREIEIEVEVEVEVEIEGRSLVFLKATACCRSLRRNPEGLILILPWLGAAPGQP